MPASSTWPGGPEAWGCGVVLANATRDEIGTCERLGRALERMSEGDFLDGNDPARLTFRVVQ